MADTLARMRQIIGSTADWAANNLVLGLGEIAIEVATSGERKIKIGDGFATFSALPYATVTPAELAAEVNLRIAGDTALDLRVSTLEDVAGGDTKGDDMPAPVGTPPDMAFYGFDRKKIGSLNAGLAVAAEGVRARSDDVPGSGRGGGGVSRDGKRATEAYVVPEQGMTMGALREPVSGVTVPMEATAAPAVIGVRRVLRLYGGIGQSLRASGGLFADNEIFTPSPGLHPSVFMSGQGVRPGNRSWQTPVAAYEQPDSFVSVNTVYETGWVRGAYKMFDAAKAATGYDLNIGINSWCQSGASWRAITRGTNVWLGMLHDLSRWREWGLANGYRVIVCGMMAWHGNDDNGLSSNEFYAAQVARSAEDFNESVKRVMNQSNDVYWYIRQVNPFAGTPVTISSVAQGQLDLALKHGLVKLVGGGSQVDHPDGTHADPRNYVWDNELQFLGVVEQEFKYGLMPSCVIDHWRTGERTWRLKVGANYPLVVDNSGAVVVTKNLAGFDGVSGLNGWQCTDGGVLAAIASMTISPDISTTGGGQGTNYIDLTLTNPPSPYGDLVLGIGTMQGPGGGLTQAGFIDFPCSIRANVAGGAVTGLTILHDATKGKHWEPATPPTVVISGAGSGATADAVVDGAGTLTGFTNVVGGAGYGGTQTYARCLRQGAGRAVGARQTVRWDRGAGSVSSLGWDGLEAASSLNPRPLNEFLNHQIVRLRR